jgi:uncharacterized protein YbjT (DUF2867 family)
METPRKIRNLDVWGKGDDDGIVQVKEMAMKIAVFGATGGTGRAVVERLLSEGHEVAAFSRRADGLHIHSERLRIIVGDVMNPSDVERAVHGQEAVIVALGISENPLRVRLMGPAHTPIDVRSIGTRNVIVAMRKEGVRRLVVQTTYGVGDTRDKEGFLNHLFFTLVLKPQIADTEKQNHEVSESGLDWVIVQPVHLTNGVEDNMPFISTEGQFGRMAVSRKSVARFLADAVQGTAFVGQSVALSGTLAPRASRSTRVVSSQDRITCPDSRSS